MEERRKRLQRFASWDPQTRDAVGLLREKAADLQAALLKAEKGTVEEAEAWGGLNACTRAIFRLILPPIQGVSLPRRADLAVEGAGLLKKLPKEPYAPIKAFWPGM